jgi:hypothetical protein
MARLEHCLVCRVHSVSPFWGSESFERAKRELLRNKL